MRIAIYGAGAIGANLGGELALAGQDVVLVDGWREHVEAIRRNGLQMSGVRGEHRVTLPALHPDEVGQLAGRVDLLVVAVKSYETAEAARRMRPTLAEDACVISAQNGLNETLLAAEFGPGAVLGCVVLIAGALWEPGQVIRTEGPNELVFGELDGTSSDRLTRICELFSCAAVTSSTDNIWGELWAKLVQNSMSNPIAGASGLLIREVREEPQARAISIATAEEGIRVGQALGYRVEPILGISAAEFLDPRVEVREAVSWRLEAQGAAVGNIRGSLPRDLMKGRRTEIDAFNGTICVRGHEAGLATPLNEAILRQIQEIERGARAIGRHNLDELSAVLRAASPSG